MSIFLFPCSSGTVCGAALTVPITLLISDIQPPTRRLPCCNQASQPTISPLPSLLEPSHCLPKLCCGIFLSCAGYGGVDAHHALASAPAQPTGPNIQCRFVGWANKLAVWPKQTLEYPQSSEEGDFCRLSTARTGAGPFGSAQVVLSWP